LQSEVCRFFDPLRAHFPRISAWPTAPFSVRVHACPLDSGFSCFRTQEDQFSFFSSPHVVPPTPTAVDLVPFRWDRPLVRTCSSFSPFFRATQFSLSSSPLRVGTFFFLPLSMTVSTASRADFSLFPFVEPHFSASRPCPVEHLVHLPFPIPLVESGSPSPRSFAFLFTVCCSYDPFRGTARGRFPSRIVLPILLVANPFQEDRSLALSLPTNSGLLSYGLFAIG